MIITSIKIPSTGKSYEFALDEKKKAGEVLEETVHSVCRKENSANETTVSCLSMWSEDLGVALDMDKSMETQGIKDGSRLIII
ncbi:hypothetical protein [Butyrivibrio sp. MC2013]|uniref:hypothetical protein n=1 Tax=Butyrivibrio sp. MC2013 TaxID=1280686 RepID=UPI0004214594|nr:hypothetical protein [Butyrivibrio sp. MC2013]